MHRKVIGTVLKVQEEVFCAQGAMRLYQRDAERLRKREALTHESQALTKSMAFTFVDELVDLNTQDKRTFQKDYEINCVLLKLLQSKWLNKSTT
jgi:hypothetical protein